MMSFEMGKIKKKTMAIPQRPQIPFTSQAIVQRFEFENEPFGEECFVLPRKVRQMEGLYFHSKLIQATFVLIWCRMFESECYYYYDPLHGKDFYLFAQVEPEFKFVLFEINGKYEEFVEIDYNIC